MTIFHFEFGKLGRGLSGGENCLIQLIDEFRKQGIRNVLLTTDNARAEYERLGLCEDNLFQYRTIRSTRTEKWFGAFGSYVVRTFMAMRLVSGINPEPGDILLCNSDFFPNSIPFRWVANRFPKTRLVYWLRMLAPDLFRGFEGHYTGRRRFPSLRFLHYKLAQALFIKLIKPRGVVLVQNTDFLRRLKKTHPHLKVHALSRYPGAPTLDFDSTKVEKQYDLAWMGRFHAQKGLFELVEILRLLKAKKPDVSLLLMGGGSTRIKKRFFAKCKEAGVAENIDYKGYGGIERLKVLAQARVFLLTSYYEGSPNVAMEALACGLPVACYDLPVYSAYKNSAHLARPLNNRAIVEAAERLLTDKDLLAQSSNEASKDAAGVSWAGIAEEIIEKVMKERV